jgi:lipoprotein LprG
LNALRVPLKVKARLEALVAGLAVLAVTAALSSCGSGGNLPSAKTLLNKSAKAMARVKTVHFDLKIDGPLSGLAIRSATGDLTAGGMVSATAKLRQLGQIVEYEYIVAGGSIYLKGPTGGFSKIPSALGDRIYDPARLLDPHKGLADTLDRAKNPKAEAAEKINGVGTYRLRADIPTDLLEGLSVLAHGQDQVEATLWVDNSTSRLVRLRIPILTIGAKDKTIVTVDLSRYDEPVDIKPPV